jgi:hypothetical protein
MASIPTQEEILAATRKSQEAMIAAVKSWFETVRTVTPKLTSVYAPLTERLPKLPPVSLPFADKLPTPEEAVGNAYHMAEQLLASQRKFAEDLLEAMTPLMPGRGEAAPEGNGSNEPKVPSHRVWQEAVAASEPKPVAASEPKPVAASEPKPVPASEAKPAAVSEPSVATASAEPKAAPRPAAKSTPARTAPRSTGATRSTAPKSGAAKNDAAKNDAAKNDAGTSTPKRTSASRTPKGPDAH